LQAGKFLAGSRQGEAGAAGAAGQAGEGKLGIQTGYADWAIFSPIWLLLECYSDSFGKLKWPKEMATFWAAFCFSKFFTFLPKLAVLKCSFS